MSVTAHNFIGQNNSGTPAEVISNLFRDSMQVRTTSLPDHSTYNTSMGTSIIRIKANMENYAGTNKAIYSILKQPIYGIMLDDFTYAIQSDWEAMQLPSILDIRAFADMAAFSGGGEIGYVARTQKYWKRSGDIKMSPKFRILDVDGTGAALQFVHVLTLMSTPIGTSTIEGVTDLINSSADAILGAKDAVLGALGGGGVTAPSGEDSQDPGAMGGLIGSLQSVATTYVDYGVNGLVEVLRKATDYATLRQAPPTLDVQIGKVFRHSDMVITDLSVVFSKECTEAGPIYADVTLSLASRKNISDVRDTGLSYNGLMSVDGNPVPNDYSNISFVNGGSMAGATNTQYIYPVDSNSNSPKTVEQGLKLPEWDSKTKPFSLLR